MEDLLCLCGEEVEELFFDPVTNEIGCENCAFLCLGLREISISRRFG